MKMKWLKSILALVLVLGLITTIIPETVKAAKTDVISTDAVLSKSEVTLTVGDSIKLNVLNLPEGSTVTWKSSKKSVAKVSSKGTITAKKAGTAKVTASVKKGDSIQKLTCRVTVAAADTTKVSVSIKENIKKKILKSGDKDAIFYELIVPSITIKNNKQATKAINAYFKAEQNSYLKLADDALKDWPIYAEALGDDALPYGITLNYNTVYHHGNLLCVDYYWDVNLGGVHPNYGVTSIVFDLSTGKQIELADITADADKTEKFLFDKAIEIFNSDPDYSDAIIYSSYEEFTEYYSLDYRWSITKDSVSLCFSAGDLMPHAAGTVTADIDIKLLAPYLNEYGLNCLFPCDETNIFKLDANPTTGYDWVVSYSKKGIVKCEGTYKQNETEEPMPGSGGKTTFVVTPLKKGLVTVTLKYKRSWEKEAIETIQIVYYVSEDKCLHKIK